MHSLPYVLESLERQLMSYWALDLSLFPVLSLLKWCNKHWMWSSFWSHRQWRKYSPPCPYSVYLRDQNTPRGLRWPITRGRTNHYLHSTHWSGSMGSVLVYWVIIWLCEKIYLSQRSEGIKMPLWKTRDADINAKNSLVWPCK